MIAPTPAVREAAHAHAGGGMQTLAEELREATDASFIAVGDEQVNTFRVYVVGVILALRVAGGILL